MARRRKPDPLFDAWWEVVLQTHLPLTPDRLQMINRDWQSLWDQVIAAPPGEIDIATVGAIAGTGANLALDQRNPEEAISRLAVYTSHPDIDSDNYVSQIYRRRLQADALYMRGDKDEACDIILTDIRNPLRKHVRVAAWAASAFVLRALDGRPADECADSRLQDLARQLLKAKRPSGRSWKRVSSHSTFCDLVELLTEGWYS